MMEEKEGLPIIQFSTTEAWEQWLEQNHATSPGVWIKVAKKGSGIASVTHAEALDVALCYGWIDGKRLGFDEQYFLQRFIHRRPRSIWSKINCEKVEDLIARGRMKPPGLAEIERAKADGRWDAAYDGQRNMQIPDDLRQALEQNPAAQEFFATLNSTNRYAILFRIHEAKKPETRARRISNFITMLSEQKKIY